MTHLQAAIHYHRLKAAWLGEGGQPVPQALANARASICLSCPKNQPHPLWEMLTAPEAARLRRTLSLKANLKLAVPGEDGLRVCDVCKCRTDLLIWCPPERIAETLDDVSEYPPECWKLACKTP